MMSVWWVKKKILKGASHADSRRTNESAWEKKKGRSRQQGKGKRRKDAGRGRTGGCVRSREKEGTIRLGRGGKKKKKKKKKKKGSFREKGKKRGWPKTPQCA